MKHLTCQIATTAHWAAGLALALSCAHVHASNSARYTLETVGPTGKWVKPEGISPGGRITGSYDNQKTMEDSMFTYVNGRYHKIPSVDPASGVAINDVGVVVGWSPGPESRDDFYQDETGRHTIKPGGFTAEDINDAGQVAGAHYDVSGRRTGAVYSIATATFEFIPGVGKNHSRPKAINNAGTVAGYIHEGSCFIYKDKVMTDIGTLGGSTCYANDINDDGEVVGESKNPKGRPRAFLWKDGQMIDLVPNQGTSWATGINNHHQIVGAWSASDGSDFFLWENGSAVDVMSLLGPADKERLEDIYRLTGINDAGEIIGWGTVEGEMRTFILKPIAP